jgi:transcription elongation factor Elf1
MKKRKETDILCKKCKNKKVTLILQDNIQFYRCDFCGEITTMEEQNNRKK